INSLAMRQQLMLTIKIKNHPADKRKPAENEMAIPPAVFLHGGAKQSVRPLVPAKNLYDPGMAAPAWPRFHLLQNADIDVEIFHERVDAPKVSKALSIDAAVNIET